MEVDVNHAAMKQVWMWSSSNLCGQQDQLLTESEGLPQKCIHLLASCLQQWSVMMLQMKEKISCTRQSLR